MMAVEVIAAKIPLLAFDHGLEAAEDVVLARRRAAAAVIETDGPGGGQVIAFHLDGRRLHPMAL